MLIYYLLLGLILFSLGVYGLIIRNDPAYRPQFFLLLQAATLFVLVALGHFLSLTNYRVLFFFISLVFVSQLTLFTLFTLLQLKNSQEGGEEKGSLKW